MVKPNPDLPLPPTANPRFRKIEDLNRRTVMRTKGLCGRCGRPKQPTVRVRIEIDNTVCECPATPDPPTEEDTGLMADLPTQEPPTLDLDPNDFPDISESVNPPGPPTLIPPDSPERDPPSEELRVSPPQIIPEAGPDDQLEPPRPPEGMATAEAMFEADEDSDELSVDREHPDPEGDTVIRNTAPQAEPPPEDPIVNPGRITHLNLDEVVPPLTVEDLGGHWFQEDPPPMDYTFAAPSIRTPQPQRRPVMTVSEDLANEREATTNLRWRNSLLSALVVALILALICGGGGGYYFFGPDSKPEVAKVTPAPPPAPAPAPVVVEAEPEPPPKPKGPGVLDCSNPGREGTASKFTKRFNFRTDWSVNGFETYYVRGITEGEHGACVTVGKVRERALSADISKITSRSPVTINLPGGGKFEAWCDMATADRCQKKLEVASK